MPLKGQNTRRQHCAARPDVSRNTAVSARNGRPCGRKRHALQAEKALEQKAAARLPEKTSSRPLRARKELFSPVPAGLSCRQGAEAAVLRCLCRAPVSPVPPGVQARDGKPLTAWAAAVFGWQRPRKTLAGSRRRAPAVLPWKVTEEAYAQKLLLMIIFIIYT